MSMGVVSAVRTSSTSPQPRATFVDAAAGTFPQMWSSFFSSSRLFALSRVDLNVNGWNFHRKFLFRLFFFFVLPLLYFSFSSSEEFLSSTRESSRWKLENELNLVQQHTHIAANSIVAWKGKRPMPSCLYACTSMKIIIKFLAYLRKNSHYNNGRDEKKCEIRQAWAPTLYPTFYEEITKKISFFPAQRWCRRLYLL